MTVPKARKILAAFNMKITEYEDRAVELWGIRTDKMTEEDRALIEDRCQAANARLTALYTSRRALENWIARNRPKTAGNSLKAAP